MRTFMLIVFAILVGVLTGCQTTREACPTDLGFKPGEMCYRWDVNVPDEILIGKQGQQQAALELVHVLIHKEGNGHDL